MPVEEEQMCAYDRLAWEDYQRNLQIKADREARIQKVYDDTAARWAVDPTNPEVYNDPDMCWALGITIS